MPTRRYIFVCEGKSEWTYLQRLRAFLDDQPMADGEFQPPLLFIAPESAIAKSGEFKQLVKVYKDTRKENKNGTIEIWTDFDLYHRNDNHCADNYRKKAKGIPDFFFPTTILRTFLPYITTVMYLKTGWIPANQSDGISKYLSIPTITSQKSVASSLVTQREISLPIS